MDDGVRGTEVRDVHGVAGAQAADERAGDLLTLGPVRDRPPAQPPTQHVVRRRVAAGAIAAVVVPLGLLVGLPGSTQTDDSGSTDTGLSAGLGPPGAGALAPLRGQWRSAPISDADVRRTLREADSERWSALVLARLPDRPLVAVLTVGPARVRLHVVDSDGRAEQVDGQRGNVVVDRLRLSTTRSPVASVFRWRTESRGTGGPAATVLGLDLESSTEPGAHGVPGAVWQRVLYTTEEFAGAGNGLDAQTQ